MHAIAVAQHGHLAAGADLSAEMVSRARLNAAAAGEPLHFEVAGFGELASTFGAGKFDALLCLGNSLPHVLTAELLSAALVDFAALLRPGGLVLIQNRNFDAVLRTRARWMEPQAHREGDSEWIFLRFYDFDPDGLITFNMLTLKRTGNAAWQQRHTSSRLRPIVQGQLIPALAAAGFGQICSYGSLAGEPFDPASSGNLVIAAYRQA